MLADLINRDDVRMVEIRGGLSFGPKALNLGIGRQLAGANHLERNRAVQADLPCVINYAHPAGSDFPKQLVISEITDFYILSDRTRIRMTVNRFRSCACAFGFWTLNLQCLSQQTLWTKAARRIARKFC